MVRSVLLCFAYQFSLKEREHTHCLYVSCVSDKALLPKKILRMRTQEGNERKRLNTLKERSEVLNIFGLSKEKVYL